MFGLLEVSIDLWSGVVLALLDRKRIEWIGSFGWQVGRAVLLSVKINWKRDARYGTTYISG
jgi:hypothetical protein